MIVDEREQKAFAFIRQASNAMLRAARVISNPADLNARSSDISLPAIESRATVSPYHSK
jgi:hypothetical protein